MTFHSRDTQELTHVCHQSVPPLENSCCDGWIIRASKGQFGYALNSVYCPEYHGDDLGKSIRCCEKFYQTRNTETAFALNPSVTPKNLEKILSLRGYRRCGSLDIQGLDIRSFPFNSPSSVRVETEMSPDWLEKAGIFWRYSPSVKKDYGILISRIPSPVFFASLLEKGEIVSLGYGVLYEKFFGLFAISTDPNFRGKGYARTIMSGLLSVAKKTGTHFAYLQVLSENIAAQKLYKSFGFSTVYQEPFLVNKPDS